MQDMIAKGRKGTWPEGLERPHKHPISRLCDVCGTEYEPDVGHRARSRTCSKPCESRLRSRNNKARGSRKLTAEQIELIRTSTEKGVALAMRFSVSTASISMIRNGKMLVKSDD